MRRGCCSPYRIDNILRFINIHFSCIQYKWHHKQTTKRNKCHMTDHTHVPIRPCVKTDPKSWQEYAQVVICIRDIWDVCQSRQFGQSGSLLPTKFVVQITTLICQFFGKDLPKLWHGFVPEIWDVCQSRQFGQLSNLYQWPLCALVLQSLIQMELILPSAKLSKQVNKQVIN